MTQENSNIDTLQPVLAGIKFRPTTREDKFQMSNGLWKALKGYVGEPTPAFWDIYKGRKAELKAAGIILMKMRGVWSVFTKYTFDEVMASLQGLNASRATDADAELLAPPGLEYLPFQKAGICFSMSHRNVLYGDEMGLGKTIQAIGALNMDRECKRVIVVCPAYLKWNWAAEIRKWYVHDNEIHIINAGDEWPDFFDGDTTHFFILNYEILGRYPGLRADACILDECFPYETLINTDKGKIKIGDIVESDMDVKVLSFDGVKTVYKNLKRRLRNPVRFDIVKVTHEHGSFTCTAHHKIYTSNGYTRAGNLSQGDALRVVRVPNCGEEAQTTILQSKPCCEMEECPAEKEGCTCGERKENRKTQSWKEEAGCLVENEDKQSYFGPRGSEEDKRQSQKESQNLPVERGERQDNPTTGASGEDAIAPNGVCDSDLRCKGELSKPTKLLQGRPSRSFGEACYRNRRADSQDSIVEILGQEENICPEFSRVVCVEILERRSGLRPFGGGSENYFYDLEVEDTHNYFANGVLVSNCHYIKSSNAKRTRAVMDLRKNIKRWFALSGTPALNRPIELFTVLNLLDPRTFPNYYQFAVRYCGGGNNGWGFEAKGATNAEELQLKMRGSCMIRRLKNEVLTELPAKRRQVIELPAVQAVQMILDEEKRIWKLHEDTIDALRERMQLAELNEDDKDYIEAAKLMAREYTVSFAEIAEIRLKLSEYKVPLVQQQIEDMLEGGVEKIVVFFHHKRPLKTLAEQLYKEGIKASIITGDVDPKERQEIVADFQNGKGVHIMLGTLGAMGTGLTLTASSTVIFAELDWRPGILVQAEDRTHRIGQQNAVLCQYLLFADSLDSLMISRVIEKMESLSAVLDKIIDSEDFEEPFEEQEVKKTKPVKGVTDAKERGLIHEALKVMAGYDTDRARTRNGAGFNKFDSFMGHRLAAEGSLSPRAAGIAKRLLYKYRRQIPELHDEIFQVKND